MIETKNAKNDIKYDLHLTDIVIINSFQLKRKSKKLQQTKRQFIECMLFSNQRDWKSFKAYKWNISNYTNSNAINCWKLLCWKNVYCGHILFSFLILLPKASIWFRQLTIIHISSINYNIDTVWIFILQNLNWFAYACDFSTESQLNSDLPPFYC